MESVTQFTVALDEPARIVRCKVQGTIRVSGLKTLAAEALAMARAHDCRRSLVDITEATAGDSITETFEFMTHLDGLGLERSDIVAVVYAKDAWSHMFAETVARNRGWIHVRYFTDFAAAESWLRQMTASPVP